MRYWIEAIGNTIMFWGALANFETAAFGTNYVPITFIILMVVGSWGSYVRYLIRTANVNPLES